MRAYSWRGPYVGVNLGHQWARTTGNPTDPAGVAGGLQAGYNFQRGVFVFGAETDIQLSSAETVSRCGNSPTHGSALCAARGGYAHNNVLFYGTVGLAYGTLRGQNSFTGFSQSRTDIGWTVGAGMEVALNSNWSARAEYLYIDLNDRSHSVTGTDNRLESSLLRSGINYRF